MRFRLLSVARWLFASRSAAIATTKYEVSQRGALGFRAGIEGTISFAKRIFGLGRCDWRRFEFWPRSNDFCYGAHRRQ